MNDAAFRNAQAAWDNMLPPERHPYLDDLANWVEEAQCALRVAASELDKAEPDMEVVYNHMNHARVYLDVP